VHAARAIHAASARRHEPLEFVDCHGGRAVRSADGLEAIEGRAAIRKLFASARGGTIVFASLGDLESSTQAEVLAAISRHADVHVIGTDRQDLERLGRLGTLRRELITLFAPNEIRIPPLRERVGEISGLVSAIVAELVAESGRPTPIVTRRAMVLLEQFDWPGNVRQLRHVLANAIARASDDCITSDEIERALSARRECAELRFEPAMTFAEAERTLILSTVQLCRGSITRTAAVLGLSRRTIQYRLREYAGRVGRRRVR
jgi:two-component system response regulator HydG